MRRKFYVISIGWALSLLLAGVASAQDPIPFVPSPMPVVERMLELARVKKDDVVYDLGSGDGRIVIHAAKKYGARGVGIDLDPKLVEQARKKAAEAGVSHLVEFRAQDALQADISEATVVTLYMFRWFNNAMRPKLERLKPGSRVVAHDFDIDDWTPVKTEELSPKPGDASGLERSHTLYLYVIGAHRTNATP
jgi:SAM-dependent methyltransferase